MFLNFDAQTKSENPITDFCSTMSASRTDAQIQHSLISIMSEIRSTNLNYAIKETPFSMYITLRKSLNKMKLPDSYPSKKPIRNLHSENSSNLLIYCEHLEQANDALKDMFEDEVIEHEAKVKVINELQEKVENLNSRREIGKDEVEAKAAQFKAISEEKRLLQIKHEKVCAENKIFKNETEALVKEVNSLNVSIKALKRDVKDGGHKNDKKCEVLEAKIKNLTEFKMVKQAEEKDLKVKMKKIDKKIKAHQEKEAKINSESLKTERLKHFNNNNREKHEVYQYKDVVVTSRLVSSSKPSSSLDSSPTSENIDPCTTMDPTSNRLDSTTSDLTTSDPSTLDPTALNPTSRLDLAMVDLTSSLDYTTLDPISTSCLHTLNRLETNLEPDYLSKTVSNTKF